MPPTLEIRSVRDGRVLVWGEFVDHDNTADADSFTVMLHRQDIKAQAKASSFMAPSLGGYFQSLASSWNGWSGPKEWSTLESEFILSATSDRTGHVTLAYRLRPPHTGYHRELSGALELESGQLELLARESSAVWAAGTSAA
jgi:hypothetical protein